MVIWESAQTCTVASVIGGDRSATPNALGDVRLTVSSGDHAWSVIVPGAHPGVVEARLKQYYTDVTTAV